MADLATIDVIAVASDQNIRQLLFTSLRSAGVKRVRLATTGEHAQALIEAMRPHLLIAEQVLSDTTGTHLAAQIKAQSEASAAAEREKYGLGGGGATAFAGDLDELLGDGPKVKPESAPAKDFPILVVTSRPTESLVAEARGAGVTAMVVRPFSQSDFALRLKAALRQQEREPAFA